MPKLVWFTDKPPSQIPDRLFVDTNIFIKIFLPLSEEIKLKERIEKFLKDLGKGGKSLCTSITIAEETAFIIIDFLVRAELKALKKSDNEIKQWTRNAYKRDKNIIAKHVDMVFAFNKFLSDYNFDVFNDSHVNAFKYIKKYNLLPRDAFFVATAIEQKADILAIDRDYSDINELNRIYQPAPIGVK